jgi:hypothetical protein
MQIAYLTLDEVNWHLAAQFALACGAELEQVLPKDPEPDGRFDAVLYDWDSLPPRQREQFLSRLLAGPLLCPVAVHSYNLDEDRVATLRRHGVAVHARLETEVFQCLHSAREEAARGHPSTMVIAYQTIHAGNGKQAAQLAQECGNQLQLTVLKDAEPHGEFDAVLYDWDHMPPRRREQLLFRLLAGRVSYPVAVHSHHLEQDHAQALSGRRVAVYPRLERAVFLRLRRAVSPAGSKP